MILKLFTPSRGVHAGLVRASRKSAGMFQVGNIVAVTWKARLEDHLGSYACELSQALTGFMFNDAARLSGLQSACCMVERTLAERDPHPELYQVLEDFLFHLKTGERWLSHYVMLEIALLQHLGFGLDLNRCAATGATEGLAYVSPKTGRAVSAEAGEPYKERLLKYPRFLHDAEHAVEDIKEGLKLTSYFLEKCFFTPHNQALPAARSRLVDGLSV